MFEVYSLRLFFGSWGLKLDESLLHIVASLYFWYWNNENNVRYVKLQGHVLLPFKMLPCENPNKDITTERF